jgi:hypothetical protein
VALKAPASRALLGKIWGTVEAEFADALNRQGIPDVQEDVGKGEPEGIPLRRLQANWEPITPPEDIVWKAAESPTDSDEVEVHQPLFEWAGELQRRVGIVVHRMLQEMRAPDRLDVSDGTVRVALRSEGLDGDKLDEAVSRAVSGLQNAVRDDRGRWILSRHEDDEREYALSVVVEAKVRRFVLDRTFVDDGTRWIIDYKTGTHAGGGRDEFLDNEQIRYRGQLESYADVMRSVDSRPIRLGLYFTAPSEDRSDFRSASEGMSLWEVLADLLAHQPVHKHLIQRGNNEGISTSNPLTPFHLFTEPTAWQPARLV